MGRFHFLSASTCWGDWVETVERDSEAACDVMGTEAHDKLVAACTPLTGHLWFSWIGLSGNLMKMLNCADAVYSSMAP